MNNIFGILASIIFIAIVIISASFFEKAGKEASRKFIHIMLANWWFIAMMYFDNVLFAMLVPAIFILVNYLSYKNNIINVMEREDEDNKSLGTVYYALSLFILSIYSFGFLKDPVVGLCGVMVMGYGDGFAAIVGTSIKSPKYTIGKNTKTLAGTITMFCITLIILSGYFLYYNTSYIVIKAILVSVLITIVEAISIKGTDNISVPLLTSLLAVLMV